MTTRVEVETRARCEASEVGSVGVHDENLEIERRPAHDGNLGPVRGDRGVGHTVREGIRVGAVLTRAEAVVETGHPIVRVA